jgi:hypothetical protein
MTNKNLPLMKLFLFIFYFLLHSVLPAQSIGLRFGHSLVPADHVSLRYEHWTNGAINLAGALAYENSRKNSLRYGCFSFDMLGEYVANRNAISEYLFGWRFGLGATIQNESEPWLFKNISFSQALNYGIVGETSLECYLTENFRASLFAQQKYLLRPALGSLRFAFGIGLTYNLSGF